MQGLALAVAACSAAGFAVSTSLQHHSAGQSPASVRSTRALLGHLSRRPSWLVAQLIAVGAFVLHGFALQLGTIVTVQPVVVSGIVLAVPARAALNRRFPSREELATVALTAIGLGVLLIASDPTAGRGAPNMLLAAGISGAAAALAVGAVVVSGRRPDRHGAAMWLGIAAGILFGVVAGLVKLAFAQVSAVSSLGPGTVLHVWTVLAVPIFGLYAVTINQRAYRAARLSASMPILNIVDVLVALGFGVVVFGEVPVHTPIAVLAQALALAAITVGMRRLSRIQDIDAEEPTPAAETTASAEVMSASPGAQGDRSAR